MFAVTLAVSTWICSSWVVAQGPITQYGHKPVVSKGPRALGLEQLSLKSDKGRLTPIAIMMNGKIYDARSYKHAARHMSLRFEDEDEGLPSVASQRVFAISIAGPRGAG